MQGARRADQRDGKPNPGCQDDTPHLGVPGKLPSHHDFLRLLCHHQHFQMKGFKEIPCLTGCHSPKVSAATGMKARLCCLQASPTLASFLSKALVTAYPSLTTDPATMACCKALTTVTSKATSLPPSHLGMRRSAGLASRPGKRNRPYFTGPRAAAPADW